MWLSPCSLSKCAVQSMRCLITGVPSCLPCKACLLGSWDTMTNTAARLGPILSAVSSLCAPPHPRLPHAPCFPGFIRASSRWQPQPETDCLPRLPLPLPTPNLHLCPPTYQPCCHPCPTAAGASKLAGPTACILPTPVSTRRIPCAYNAQAETQQTCCVLSVKLSIQGYRLHSTPFLTTSLVPRNLPIRCRWTPTSIQAPPHPQHTHARQTSPPFPVVGSVRCTHSLHVCQHDSIAATKP